MDDAASRDPDEVIDGGRQDSLFMKARPGFVCAQLYRGIGDGQVLTNVAVWETLTSFKEAFTTKEFPSTLTLHPNGSLSHPVLVRAAAVPGVCVT